MKSFVQCDSQWTFMSQFGSDANQHMAAMLSCYALLKGDTFEDTQGMPENVNDTEHYINYVLSYTYTSMTKFNL